jgi:hypothetical protein
LIFEPLPLADLDARLSRTSMHLEGVPPLTFAYGDAAAGRRQQTQLSIINATLREVVFGGLFVGIGQTIYNQRTTYPPDTAGAAPSVTQQASRVTGARLEIGLRGRLTHGRRFEFVAAVNPSMRGLEYTTLRAPAPFALVANPENAVQVDTALRIVTPLRRGALVYGLRYLNYASRYSQRGTPLAGSLADRNVGFMPLVGYRFRL